MVTAFSASSLAVDTLVVWVIVEYDGAGRVVSARVDPSSGDRRFDKRVVKWAYGLRICSTTAGMGRIPLTFWK